MNLLGLNPQAIAIKALGAALLAAFLFGSGYYVASREYMNTAAVAAQNAAVAAQQAQAQKDAADLKAAQADMNARQQDNATALSALEQVIKDRDKLVPTPPGCVVPAPAMKLLNDPKLVGTP